MSFGSSNPNWLIYSATSHHVISDFRNLSLQNDYISVDEILIRDSIGLDITHISSTHLTTHTSLFKLSNILCVPNMQKILIYIAKFWKTNNTSVEYFLDNFLIKNLNREILTQGRNKEDFYEWSSSASSSSTPMALVSIKASMIDWYNQLGHPSSRILESIVKFSYLLALTNTIKFLSCNSCHSNKSHRLQFNISFFAKLGLS